MIKINETKFPCMSCFLKSYDKAGNIIKSNNIYEIQIKRKGTDGTMYIHLCKLCLQELQQHIENLYPNWFDK